jgi:calcium/calmodulin-dependent protein kinase I
LCGYTPFDRDSNLEEMQAILVADYSFTPVEYWRNVSVTARDFIKKCLTIDPNRRMTSHQALQHPWMKSTDPTSPEVQEGGGEDLLPTVKKNFNARRTLHKAIDTVRAINKLREGGGLMMGGGNAMDGGMSLDPRPKGEQVNGSKVMNEQGESMEGIAQGGSGALDAKDGPPEKTTAQGGDAMEVDSRGNARGQTQEQILQQERKIKDTMTNMWHKSTR